MRVFCHVGILLIIALLILFLGLTSWSVIALGRRLRRHHAGHSWWIAFGVLVAGGLTLGGWCAFCCEYQANAQMRIGSFPFPVAFYHLESGNWIDFVVPGPVACLAVLTDMSTITSLGLLPLWVASWLWHKKTELQPHA